jgi:hypothetical protein
MTTRHILAVLSLIFLSLGGFRWVKRRDDPAARTWLIIGAVFGLVAMWLWLNTPQA